MRVLVRRPHQRLSRAVVKTLGYRVFMVCITVTVAFVVVGDAGDALNIGLARNLLKTGMLKTGTYFAHDGRGTASAGV